jgi:hypothetical protein
MTEDQWLEALRVFLGVICFIGVMYALPSFIKMLGDLFKH